jgi:hypothetical protein
MVPHRFEKTYCPQAIDQQCLGRSRPGFARAGLRGQVIDFIGPGFLNGRSNVRAFRHVTKQQLDLSSQMTGVVRPIPAFPPRQPENPVPFAEQPFGEK